MNDRTLNDILKNSLYNGWVGRKGERAAASAWAKAKPPTRATLVQAVYEGVTVRGEEFVSVRLTAEAYAHALALALPEEVSVPAIPSRGRPRKNMALARPTGLEPATFGSGTQRSIH